MPVNHYRAASGVRSLPVLTVCHQDLRKIAMRGWTGAGLTGRFTGWDEWWKKWVRTAIEVHNSLAKTSLKLVR
jgi:hypothetical protein